jgi:type III pantothenate kinase
VILLLDAGNTRIKWGLWHGGAWHDRGAIPVSEPEALREILAAAMPSWVGVACVAGDEVRTRLTALLDAIELELFWLKSATQAHGLVNCYDRPETLGVDRYAALIACSRGGHAPCVVVSAGTAVTVDALAGNGEFLGGMILPGAALMRRSLAAGTAAVTEVNGTWQRFPRSTGAAVETGIRTAISATVTAMHTRLSLQLGQTVATVITGGDAEMVAGVMPETALSGPVVINEYLVLEGLLWLAKDMDVPGV